VEKRSFLLRKLSDGFFLRSTLDFTPLKKAGPYSATKLSKKKKKKKKNKREHTRMGVRFNFETRSMLFQTRLNIVNWTWVDRVFTVETRVITAFTDRVYTLIRAETTRL
jgi:hypothetical protein